MTTFCQLLLGRVKLRNDFVQQDQAPIEFIIIIIIITGLSRADFVATYDKIISQYNANPNNSLHKVVYVVHIADVYYTFFRRTFPKRDSNAADDRRCSHSKRSCLYLGDQG